MKEDMSYSIIRLYRVADTGCHEVLSLLINTRFVHFVAVEKSKQQQNAKFSTRKEKKSQNCMVNGVYMWGQRLQKTPKRRQEDKLFHKKLNILNLF